MDDLDFSLLPAELAHLAALIPLYAESDDAIRSDLLEQASDDDLALLGTTTDGHWDAINAFLDENMTTLENDLGPGPELDLALALDAFAQAAMEAGYELERRHPT